MTWHRVTDQPPPKNQPVMTKVHTAEGDRLHFQLVFTGQSWTTPEGEKPIQTPTHWRPML